LKAWLVGDEGLEQLLALEKLEIRDIPAADV
jgi:hypothetical protein